MTNVPQLQNEVRELREFLNEVEGIVINISVAHSQFVTEMNEDGLEEVLLQAEKLVKDIVSVEDFLLGYGDVFIEAAARIVRTLQSSIDNLRRHRITERTTHDPNI